MTCHRQIHVLAAFFILLAAAVPDSVLGAPGDVLFTDTFSRATLAPWTTTNAARSGILTGAPTSGASPNAGYTRNAAVTVTSPTFIAAVPAARLSLWVRRGSDAISEDTDPGEDFVIEYRTAGGGWNQIATFLGSGTKGQIYQSSFTLPAAARHGTAAIRVRQTNGSGFDFDYWHFDDVLVTEIALPGPLSVGTCDDFEGGLTTNWTITATGGFAGTSSATSSSPSNSMYLNGGIVQVTSNAVDTNDITFSDISVWVRRGSDAFSEDPDGSENLTIEYLDSTNNWILLETFSGSGGPGQTFTRTYSMPTTATHAGFRMRFGMTAGSGATWDFWHIDDVCLVQTFVPILQVSKVATTLSDPVNGSSGPKQIPGAIVQYTIGVLNQGMGSVDASSLIITDPLPPNTALYVTTVSGDPVSFVDGSPASGLSFNYATDITFSNQLGGGAPYTYVPIPDAQGFDPAVTGIRVAPTGSMNGDSGSGAPNFEVVFRLRIE